MLLVFPLQAEAAEYQRRREEAAAARLAALRNASLPEYLEMLKKTKNSRLQEVLGQTDACLRQLADKLAGVGKALMTGGFSVVSSLLLSCALKGSWFSVGNAVRMVLYMEKLCVQL